MAETLTYDPTPADPEVLTNEEKDSLKVGEALIEQQDQLLAGKYKDAQDLEKAYIELEKKLGTDNLETSTESEPEAKSETKEEEKPDQSTLLDDLWEQSQANEFNNDTLDQVQKMDPRELANMYLAYRSQNTPKELSKEDVTAIKDVAGGEEGYAEMIDWANKNLEPNEIDMFDQVMERGDPLSAFFAVRALAYRYDDATGVEGTMTTGTSPKTSNDVFRSQQEVVTAMSDSRYERDPAYRQDIMKKLERSDIKF